MSDYTITRGATSQTIEFDVLDSSSSTGDRLTGLAHDTGSLVCYYYRQNAAGETAITLVTATLGTWVTSGFIVIDATNMPGRYQLHLPDAAIANSAGVDRVTVTLEGAANMVPVTLSIDLVDSLILGADDKVVISTDAQDLSATLDVNTKTTTSTLDFSTTQQASLDARTPLSGNGNVKAQIVEGPSDDILVAGGTGGQKHGSS